MNEEAQRVVCLLALKETDPNRQLLDHILNMLKRKRGSVVPFEIWIKDGEHWISSAASEIPPVHFGEEEDIFPAAETSLKRYKATEVRAVLVVADGGFVTPPTEPMLPGRRHWCVVLPGVTETPACIPRGVKVVLPLT